MTEEHEARLERMQRKWEKDADDLLKRHRREKDPEERAGLMQAIFFLDGEVTAAKRILEILREEA